MCFGTPKSVVLKLLRAFHPNGLTKLVAVRSSLWSSSVSGWWGCPVGVRIVVLVVVCVTAVIGFVVVVGVIVGVVVIVLVVFMYNCIIAVRW